MTDPRTPEELGAALDRYLPADTAALPAEPSGDIRLNTAAMLAASPRPLLSEDARARMKAKMLAAVPEVQGSSSAPETGMFRPILRILIAASAAAAVVIVAVLGVTAIMRGVRVDLTPTAPAIANVTEPAPTTPAPSAEPTIQSTRTVAADSTDEPVPTETVIAPTATSLPPTVTPPPTQTATEPTVITDIPTDSAPLAPTASPALTAHLIIEGRVEDISGQQITISGFDIVLSEDHPLLKVLRVNDEVRLSGELLQGRGDIVIAVETFELANEDTEENIVELNPDGAIWRDPGNCQNPPPEWATAKGWRARCEGDGANGSDNGNNGNNGSNNPNRPDKPGRPDSPGNSENAPGNQKK